MRYRFKRQLKLVVFVVIFIGLVIWVAVWAAHPREGVIVPPPEAQLTTPHTSNTLDGTYISFEYNGKYTAREDVPRNENIEMYTLYADTRYDKRILASVATLPDGRLETYAAYIYRQKATNVYASRKVQVAGSTVDVWTKNDGTEQTAFIPHNDKVAVISFVTTNTSDQLTGEMDSLLKTFQWKK